MSQLIWERQTAIGNIGNLVGTAPISTAKLRLFQNDFHPNQTSVLADFTEADYTGYTEADPTWGAIYYDTPSGLAIASYPAVFQPTGTTVANTIYGWYITDDPATIWFACERFDNPVQMASGTDVCEFFARLFAAVVES